MTLVIAVLEVSGRPAGLDPAVLIPMAVLCGAALDGLLGGSIGGVIGAAYIVMYYSDPALASAAAGARVLAGLAATALSVLIAVALRDRATAARRRAARRIAESDALVAFAARLGAEPPEAVAQTIVRGAVEVLDADMAVLTVLDPPSGRHIVRAAYGGSGAAVGIEVLPGAGITGLAIRDRRIVVATGQASDAHAVTRIQRRLQGRTTAQAMAALPALQAGRVIATLTIGRADGTPFGSDEKRVLAAMAPLVTLAATGTLARREADVGSPRDAVTGLYNKAYLEAALEQLIALRRREPAEERPPLSLIMFDIDGFATINDRHGRHVGDHVLRSVATVLRQRFRASDVVARVGSDSFLVVLNGATPEIAAEAAAQIRRQVRDLHLSSSSGEAVSVTLSASNALYREGQRPVELFGAAETALEKARWSGPGAAVAI